MATPSSRGAAPHPGRSADAEFQRLVDISNALDQAAIVATTDVAGRITHANDKFCEISGYSREELLGQDHRIINSGYHSRAFMRELWRTIAAGRVWHGEIRNRRKDGTFYWVDTTIVPFLDSRGKPYQYIAIRADITKRKAAEALLREQAALARVGQMAAIVAHEVKNPLAGIKGVIQVLLTRRDPDDREVPVLTEVVGRIDALNDLIQDLLIFARPRPPQLGEVPLRPLLVEAVTMLRRDPVGRDVEVTVAPCDVQLTLDAEMVRGAILNLLLNAAQAMQGDGRITIDVERRTEAWAIAVRDTGPGIAPDVRAQVFEPFFTTKARGSGLGLAVGRRTAEVHGGTLEMACPADGGTVMTLVLPERPGAARAAADRASEDVGAGGEVGVHQGEAVSPRLAEDLEKQQ